MKAGIIFLALAFFLVSLSFSHSGRTNSKGCHTNRKTGDYHCHGSKKTPQRNQPAQTYNRSNWGNWVDADGDCQNTRHEVLIEESLVPVTFKTDRKCIVVYGKWIDPYTGGTFTMASLLDVDHVVPLKEAYLSGAKNWSRSRKRQYANSLQNKDHLIAVYRGANRSKGAKDIAQWLPSNPDYHKEYIRIWIEIKEAWGLKIDSAERQVINKILGD